MIFYHPVLLPRHGLKCHAAAAHARARMREGRGTHTRTRGGKGLPACVSRAAVSAVFEKVYLILTAMSRAADDSVFKSQTGEERKQS